MKCILRNIVFLALVLLVSQTAMAQDQNRTTSHLSGSPRGSSSAQDANLPLKSPLRSLLSSPRTKQPANNIEIEVNVGHNSPIVAGDVSDKSGLFVTATREGEIIVWNTKAVKPLRRISSGMNIGGLTIADNGYLLCIGGHFKTGEQELKVFDLLSGLQVGESLFAEIGYNSGYYGDAYRPTAISLPGDKVVGIGVDRSIWIARLSSFLPRKQYDERLATGSAPAYTRLTLPHGSSMDLPRQCRFLSSGKMLLVATQLLSEERNIMSPYLWDADKVRDSEITSFIYDTEAMTWERRPKSLQDEPPFLLSESASLQTALFSDFSGQQEVAFERVGNMYHNRIDLPSGRAESIMYFDSQTQWLFSGKRMFNLQDFVSKPSPFDGVTYLALFQNARFAYVSRAQRETNRERLVAFEIRNFHSCPKQRFEKLNGEPAFGDNVGDEKTIPPSGGSPSCVSLIVCSASC